jgi:hypothetical protein
MIVGKGIANIDIDIPNDAYDTGKDVPTFRAYLTAVVRDSTGKIIKVHRQKSHSPTPNFIGLMLPLNYFVNTGNSFTLTNTGGGTCSYRVGTGSGPQDIPYPNNNNSANYPTYLLMIQVGSGSQSNPSSATKLAAPIPNGSSTGQLIYGTPTTPSNIVVSGSSAYFTISQAFANQSGSTINVTEVGIILQLYLVSYNGNPNSNCGQVLVWYDVLSSALSIPNGGSLVIYYTFTVNP